jgi:S-formylglutathione hydrolase FrmB
MIEKDPQPPNPGIPCWIVASDYQNGPTKLEVLAPDKLEPGRKYPVVIMLPVNTGTWGNWGSSIVEAKKLNLHNAFQAILVAPAFDTEPWGGDHPTNPKVRQQSYVLDAVLPFVQKEFPADPAQTHLIGFSKSGLGALSLFLRNPDKFAKVAVFDPFGRVDSQQIFNTWGLTASYGPRDNFDKFDPFLLVPQKKDQLKQGRRVTLIAGGPGTRRGVDNLRDLLADNGCSFTYVLISDAGHDWRTGWLPVAFTSLLPLPGGAK